MMIIVLAYVVIIIGFVYVRWIPTLVHAFT